MNIKTLSGLNVDWTELDPILQKLLLDLTGRFEGGGSTLEAMYSNITGNFDGMGISAGPLQWNYGCGSLQPLLKLFVSRYGKEAMDKPFIGMGRISHTAQMSQSEAVEESKKWQTFTNGKWALKPEWKKAWQTLLSSTEMKDIMNERMLEVWEKVKTLCGEWGMDSIRAHAFFLDIVTQNGGMSNQRGEVTLQLVLKALSAKDYIPGLLETIKRNVIDHQPIGLRDFFGMVGTKILHISELGQEKINELSGANFNNSSLFFDHRTTEKVRDRAISILGQPHKTTLENLFRLISFNFPGDRRVNYTLWTPDIFPEDDKEKRILFVAAFLRANYSSPAWKLDVFNRKGAIAAGLGRVHSVFYDWRDMYAGR